MNKQELLKKLLIANKKLTSLGYEKVFSNLTGDKKTNNKFGSYYMKYNEQEKRQIGSTWLNILTIDSIIEAKDESEILQIEHI
jgi:hypothetical protein